ncbi:MAG: hypothetical protein AAFP19_06930 [Bacteroidota bacterium]
MNQNILRQVKDIQYQADKLLKGHPSLSDIKDFRRYAQEINTFLQKHIDIPEVHQLVDDIPSIKVDLIDLKTGLLFMIMPAVLVTWYYERRLINIARSDIQIAKGKYASIEFLLKNYF